MSFSCKYIIWIKVPDVRELVILLTMQLSISKELLVIWRVSPLLPRVSSSELVKFPLEIIASKFKSKVLWRWKMDLGLIP